MAETENHIKIKKGDVIFFRKVAHWPSGKVQEAHRVRVDAISKVRGGVELHYGIERTVDESAVSGTFGTPGYINGDQAVVPITTKFNGEWGVKKEIHLKPLVRRGNQNHRTRWGHH